MANLVSVEKVIYNLLKAFGLIDKPKYWERILKQKKISAREAKKLINIGIQSIFKEFNIKENTLLYKDSFETIERYEYLLQHIEVSSNLEQKHLDWIISIHFFIPWIAINLAEYSSYDIKVFDKLSLYDFWYLPTKNKTVTAFMLEFYRNENGYKSYEEMANKIEEKNYDSLIKQFFRIRNNGNIPHRDFCKIFETPFDKLFLIAIALDNIYKELIEKFSKEKFFELIEFFKELFQSFHKALSKNDLNIEKYSKSSYISNILNSEFIFTPLLKDIQKDTKFSLNYKKYTPIDKNSDEIIYFDKNEKMLKTLIDDLFKESEPNKIKNSSNEANIKLWILKLKEFANDNLSLLNLFIARDNLYSQKFEEALNYYEKAFKLLKSSSKEKALLILKEALYLSAYLDKKREFQKYINFLQQYDSINSQLYNISMIEFYKITFFSYFRFDGFYEKIEKDNIREFFSKKIIYTKDIENIDVDIKNPNKSLRLKNFPKELPQIIFFSSIGQIDKIKKLIEAKANINITDRDSENALMSAIQANHFEIAYLLLEQKEIRKSINTKTKKNGYTILSETIKTYDLNLLKKLLEIKELDVNLAFHNDNLSAIYFLLSNLSSVNIFRRKILLQQFNNYLKLNAIHMQIFEEVLNFYMPIDKDIEIKEMIKYLLDRGANINKVEIIENIGSGKVFLFTPLMYIYL